MRGQRFLVLFAVLALGVLATASMSYALGTPAGTEIINQASATYLDANGNPFVANSNQVITVVLPVYGLTIEPSHTGTDPSDVAYVPGQEQISAPGAWVSFPYILTNTGNDVDNFNLGLVEWGANPYTPDSLKIFYDENRNGIVDAGEDTVTVLVGINPDEEAGLIVRYRLPVTAAGGDELNINITGQSQGDNTQTDVDNYHRTTVTEDAVIAGNKYVSVSEASAGDNITYTIRASNVGQQPTTSDTLVVDIDGAGTTDEYYGVFIADPLPVFDPTDLTSAPFEITGTPTGTPSVGTVIYWVHNTTPDIATHDSLDNAIWSDGTWYDNYANAAANGDIRAIGWVTGTTTLGSGVILAGQTFNFVFDVRIPVNYPAGIVRNDALIEYDDDDGDERTTPTNEVITVVGGDGNENVAIMIGPSGAATDHDLDVANEDTTVVATIAAAETQNITLTIYNPGNAPDVINIKPATVPAGWVVGYYYLDGVTPLGDTNTDGLVDMGEIPVGGTASFIAKVTVPADQAGATNQYVTVFARSSNDPTEVLPTISETVIAGASQTRIPVANPTGYSVGDYINVNHEIVVVSEIIVPGGGDPDTLVVVPAATGAPSAGDDITGPITSYNKTVIHFQAVTSAELIYVDRNQADNDNTVFDQNGTPGSYVDFPLDVRNPAVRTDTYTLSDSLPASWRVEYYLDADNNGAADPSEIIPVTSITVDGGYVLASTDPPGEGQLIARIFIPGDYNRPDPGTYLIKYIATSSNNTTVMDTVYDSVTIPENPALILEPDRSGTGTPGYTVEYYHNLINTGNLDLLGRADAAGDTTFITITSDLGWSYAIFQAHPTTGVYAPLEYDSANDRFWLEYTVGVNAAADSTSSIRVIVYIPSNAPGGTLETGTICAYHSSISYPGVFDCAVDLTTVVDGNLRLEKRVVNTNPGPATWANAATFNEGEPGETLRYFVKFHNIGSTALDSIIIYDAIPQHVTYVAGSAQFEAGSYDPAGMIFGGNSVQWSIDGGATWLTVEPGDPTTVTNIRWRFDTSSAVGEQLLSGESGRVYFEVTID